MDDLQETTLTEKSETYSKSQELVSWIMDRVVRWRNARDREYDEKWQNYWSLWKGEWNPRLKAKNAERSKLIAPALQQAVDQTVAEMVEATFGRGTWVDISDDIDPMERAAAEKSRDQLLRDFDRDGVSQDIRESYVNGAIFGTGIAKRIVDEVDEEELKPDPLTGEPIPVITGKRVRVLWEAVNPRNFVIDTAATSIESALGVAHETTRPIHEVKEKQLKGEYIAGPIGNAAGYAGLGINTLDGAGLTIDPLDAVFVTEYHGLIPARLLDDKEKESLFAEFETEEKSNQESSDLDVDDILVEAIVTIGNGDTLLKAVRNPFMSGDRGWIAYPHDIVPSSFWGRGVCEKGFNSQSALDAELRARIDALGLLTYPVIGADATRLPRNLNLQVSPGKVFLTNGRPSEIIEPLKFGNLEASTFQQSGDLERMVQMATGAVDTATPIDVNSRNSTATGTSMIAGAVVKRAKMTMHNVDTRFLDPMVRKSLLVLRQLDPERFPIDLEFTVNSTMSIMAREFEQTQMTNLLAIVPPESPAYLVILQAIVENYSGPSKDKIVKEIEAMRQPNQDPMQAQMQQLQAQGTMMEVQKLQAEIAKIAADIELIKAKTITEMVKAEFADDEMQIKSAQTVIDNKYADIQAINAKIKASTDVAKMQLDREKMRFDITKEGIKLKQQQEKAKEQKNKPKTQ